MSTDSETRPESMFPPHVLREYALVADGERGALVGPRGDIAWMCAPKWHGDAIFSTLIGGGGCYAVTPADPRFVWGGYYEDGSLIWRRRWITGDGVIECREALAYLATPGLPSCCAASRPSTPPPGSGSCWTCGPVSDGTR